MSAIIVVIQLFCLPIILAKNSPMRFIGTDFIQPWSKGSHMCAYYLTDGGSVFDDRYYPDCFLFRTENICGHPTKVEYECCPGYTEDKKRRNLLGCPKAMPLLSMSELLRTNWLDQWHNIAEQAGLLETLRSGGAFTMFTPTNEALRNIEYNVRHELTRRDDSYINYHLIKGRLYTQDFYKNEQVPTLYFREPVILNRYCNGIVTVNCARVIQGNVEALNGVVHKIDRVIVPIPQTRSNVYKALVNDDRISNFASRISLVNGLMMEIQNVSCPFTVFAPTNRAWKRIPASIQSLVQDKQFLKKLVKFHIIRISMCASAVTELNKVRTLEGQKLNITCDLQRNKRRVVVNDDVPIQSADIVSNNGVVHIIDEVLIPFSVMPATFFMQKMGIKTFASYIRQVGLERHVDGMQKKTIFIPTEAAWLKLSSEIRSRLSRDSRFLEEVINSHIIKGQYRLGDFIDKKNYENKAKRDVHIRVHRGYDSAVVLSVSGIEVKMESDFETATAAIHYINDVLIPPDPLMQILRSDLRFRQFYDLLQRYRMSSWLESLRDPFTLFVPNSEAFKNMNSETQKALEKRTSTEKILKHHLWTELIPIFTFHEGTLHYIKSASGNECVVERKKGNTVFIDDTIEIDPVGLMVPNGYIYFVGGFIFPEILE